MLARNPVLLADDPRNDFALADPHDSDDHREHAHPQAAKLTQREGNDTCTLEGTRHADTAAKNCPSGVDIGEAQDAPEIDRPIIQEASLGGANFYETILRQATLKRATLPPANLKTVTTHIGQRVRQLRWMRELTQHQLAQRIGVKLQQLQSYETGSKRISAGRLWAIATVLEVPISSFFEGLAEPAADTTKSRDNVRTATKAG
ncbi:XRE family transcriptional regulator [Candidatus Parcubacteria bacterium]|nr:MAG: XRE family transcriptional regulator [Candidatus Parcubacteria bacterium]